MTAEIHTTLFIVLICWFILLAIDALICGLFKIIAGIPFKKAFLWGCLSLIIPPAVIAYGSLVERNRFKVERVEIEHQALPASFDGYQIVHISDIHARSFEGREKHLQKAVDLINSLNPDIITFTGDLITMTPDELEDLAGILGNLKASDGVFSVLGNHDYCIYSDLNPESRKDAVETLVKDCQEMGWTPLINENRIITRCNTICCNDTTFRSDTICCNDTTLCNDSHLRNFSEAKFLCPSLNQTPEVVQLDSIAIIGVENTSTSKHFPSKGNLAKASEGTAGIFRILLSHDPLHWESEIIGQDYPLTLSGHTHAMQFSLFRWSPSKYIFPQYRGLYCTEKSRCGNPAEYSAGNLTGDSAGDLTGDSAEDLTSRQYLYVNTGLGETIFPARIGVRPEITLITLISLQSSE